MMMYVYNKHRMRVALLFSGQPRFVDGRSYRSIKEHLLDKYECTCFCHYWIDDKPMPVAPWSGLNMFMCDKNVGDMIKALYSPVACRGDPPLLATAVTQYTNTTSPITPYNLSSMYKSMHECWQLYEAHKDHAFDFYIRLRYDCVILAFPDLHAMHPDALYVADHHPNQPCLANNILCTGREAVMRTVMSIYHSLDNMAAHGVLINDEQCMFAHAKNHEIPVVKVPLCTMLVLLPTHFCFDMR